MTEGFNRERYSSAVSDMLRGSSGMNGIFRRAATQKKRTHSAEFQRNATCEVYELWFLDKISDWICLQDFRLQHSLCFGGALQQALWL